MLHRALENLLRNAVSHSPAGGHVLIVAPEDAARRYVNITVSDDDPGVPAAALPQIFQPFFRSDAKATFSGYGLGLAITRGVVEKHGGRVAALNRPAGGLEVRLILPVESRAG